MKTYEPKEITFQKQDKISHIINNQGKFTTITLHNKQRNTDRNINLQIFIQLYIIDHQQINILH